MTRLQIADFESYRALAWVATVECVEIGRKEIFYIAKRSVRVANLVKCGLD